MHFRGNHVKPINSSDLHACVQKEGESLADYTRRFIHLECQATDVNEATVIETVIQGLRIGAARSEARRQQPKTLDHMIRILESQVRVDEDVRTEKELKQGQHSGGGDRRPRHDNFRDRGHDGRRHPYSSGGRSSEHHYRQPRKEILNVEQGEVSLIPGGKKRSSMIIRSPAIRRSKASRGRRIMPSGEASERSQHILLCVPRCRRRAWVKLLPGHYSLE